MLSHPLLTPEQEKHIVDSLVSGNLLNVSDIDDIQKHAALNEGTLFDLAIEHTNLSTAQAAQLIAREHNWRFMDLDRWRPNDTNHLKIPLAFAKAKRVVLFSCTENEAHVAMSDPRDTETLHLVEKYLGRPTRSYFAAKEHIKTALRWYKIDIHETVNKLVAMHEAAVKTKAQDNSVPLLFDVLVRHAIASGASDLHIEPQRTGTAIRIRIDGLMQTDIVLPKTIHDLLILRVKVLARLRTDEHMVPQDGKISIFDEDDPNERTDIRVSIVPTIVGEKAVMRILSSSEQGLNLNRLGFSRADLEIMKRQSERSWGMILVTGPTGSGKTTTLYGLLKILNVPEDNLMTIEDPVEYEMKGLTQIQVNSDVGLTFSSGLRTIVRQDPDTILVGEIRDEETANIGVNAAMTGHLVLSTLHTNDAATAFPRLLDMNVEPFLVASTVNIVVAQRLVRKICTHCIHSEETSLDELTNRLPIHALELLGRQQKTLRLFKGLGCPMCKNSGYLGRIGIFEMLEVTPEIKQLILKRASADDIAAQAKRQGMHTMFEDGIDKVLQGMTTIEEVYRVSTTS
jgi:type IV pilus assembly protein PilB